MKSNLFIYATLFLPGSVVARPHSMFFYQCLFPQGALLRVLP